MSDVVNKSRRRRWRWLLAALGIVIVLLWFLLPALAAPFVRARLQAMVAQQLDARLDMGSLRYLPPYGVSVSDVRLVADGPDGRPVELLSTSKMTLKLARLPLRMPLLIQSIDIENPHVHVIRTAEGIVGQRALARSVTESKTSPEAARQKLSELLRLRHLVLRGGQIEYENRAAAGSVPLLWKDLQIDLTTQARSASAYAYHVTAGNGAVASLDTSGSFDIDQLLLQLDHCAVRARVDPAAASSPVPGELQTWLRDYSVKGSLSVDVNGTVPLRDPRRGQLTCMIDLPGASGRMPDGTALDELALKLTCTAGPTTQPAEGEVSGTMEPQPLVRLTFDRFAARSGGASIGISPGATVVANGATRAWGLSGLVCRVEPGAHGGALPASLRKLVDNLKLRGGVVLSIDGAGPLAMGRSSLRDVYGQVHVQPQGLSLQPPPLEQPLTDVAPFAVTVAEGQLQVQTLRAQYGQDVFFLRELRVPLGQLPGRIVAEHLAGAVTLDRRHPRYPAPLGELVERFDPYGPFFFEGKGSIDLSGTSAAPDYQIKVSTDRAGMTIPVSGHKLLARDVQIELAVAPQRVDLNRLQADLLSGSVSVDGWMALGHRPAAGEPAGAATSAADLPTYSAQVRLNKLDLNELAQVAVPPGGKPMTVSGEISGEVALSGSGIGQQAIHALTGRGKLAIRHGNLWSVPVMQDVVRGLHLHQALTVAQAAAVFTIGQGRVNIDQAAVAAPAIGVQGDGWIGLDKTVDLHVIAVPLSDWEQNVRGNSDSPVAEAAGALAGAIQQGVNTVTRQLLYEVNVKGQLPDPDILEVPAPVLSRGAERLFGSMFDGLRDDRLPEVGDGGN